MRLEGVMKMCRTDFDVLSGYDAHSSTDEARWSNAIDFNAVRLGP